MSPGRSFTGNHDLLPASKKKGAIHLPENSLSDRALAKLSGGTVIWRIWPAVLLHTVFAAVIVVLTQKTNINLAIPNIMLTLLGVVIGFVISLRVSSGYDRYWWGRCAWSDIVKNSRTMSRLIWIHIPAKVSNTTDANGGTPRDEIGQAMREKRIALELIEAFAISVKHYVRGELGIYYEDLYHVVRPFHEHHALAHIQANESRPPPVVLNGGVRTPRRQHSIESYSQLASGQLQTKKSQRSLKESTTPKSQASGSNPPSTSRKSSTLAPPSEEPVAVPPITGYGTINKKLRHSSSRTSLGSSHSSEGEHDPLLPSVLPGPQGGASTDLIPFMATMSSIGRAINPYYWYRAWRAHWREGFEGNDETGGVNIRWAEEGQNTSKSRRKHRRAARQTHVGAGKHRPRVAGDGENLPLEIIRCMSEWLSLLDNRGVVPGNALGGLYGCVAAYEDLLGTLERILTTPLPYVYSQHISTVWLYLFFLPFQLAHDFNWYTIPGTAVAAFFYLGFIAAGDEIEQPFGYDENDLDLDLFCREVITADLRTLTLTPFPNAHMGSHIELEINESSTVADVSLNNHHDRA